MERLILLGLNHTTAKLEVRERLAFDAAQRDAALGTLRQRLGPCEIVLISTCNRTEIYAVQNPDAHPRSEDLLQYLCEFSGLRADELRPHLYEKTDRAVVAHLFSVASSLDSMVLGETQILGQVRQAYEAARAAGTAGAMFHPLFQRATAVGKQILAETSLAEGRISVASVAVDYARRIFDTFADKTVLSIGAGKMAALMLANLSALSPGKLLACNRDPAKSEELAHRFGADSVDFAQLGDHLAQADIVVTSTGSKQPIVGTSLFEIVMRKRRYKPVFLIDVALPRDVAAQVGEMENVYLYNLDDLQQVVAATRSQRGAALEAARKILDEQVEYFIAWHRTRQLGPTIDQIYRRSHELAQEELTRTLGKLPSLSDAQRRHLEELTRRIVNKLLHDPIRKLRDGDGSVSDEVTHEPPDESSEADPDAHEISAKAEPER